MKKTYLLLIILMNFSVAYGQRYSAVIADGELSGFLNWLVKNEKDIRHNQKRLKIVYFKTIKWDIGNFIAQKVDTENNRPQIYGNGYLFYKNLKIDSAFSTLDKAFLLLQFNGIKDSVWHRNTFKARLLRTKKQIKPNRFYLSIPLFSIDRKFVIVRKLYYCGSLCADGGIYIYKKLDNNTWENFTTIYRFIS